jgi:NAD(P)-dependent dehydrogenase (short-subunit alcohol dehydrogenase family)
MRAKRFTRRRFFAMNRSPGKVAAVAGGTSGIGLATAKAFLREGARRQTQIRIASSPCLALASATMSARQCLSELPKPRYHEFQVAEAASARSDGGHAARNFREGPLVKLRRP